MSNQKRVSTMVQDMENKIERLEHEDRNLRILLWRSIKNNYEPISQDVENEILTGSFFYRDGMVEFIKQL